MRPSRWRLGWMLLAGILLCAGLWYLCANRDGRALPEIQDAVTPPVDAASSSTSLQSPAALPLAAGPVANPHSSTAEDPGTPNLVAHTAKRAQSPWRRVNGTVVPVNGKLPLDGVKVEVATELTTPGGLSRNATQATTHADGSFTLELPPADIWPIDALCEVHVFLRSFTGMGTPQLRGTQRLLEDGMEIVV